MKLCFVLAIFILLTEPESGYSTSKDVASNEEKLLTEKGIINDEVEDNTDFNPFMFTEIFHYTRKGNVIDISLDRKHFYEVCYVKPPNKELVTTSLLELDGVLVQNRSEFVSCRITIGPIDDDLIGKWELCGLSEESGELRCQPVSITWNNYDSPAVNWSVVSRPNFEHSMGLLDTVTVGIVGTETQGSVSSCHLITSHGEDLVMKTDMQYPHIVRSEVDNEAMCAVKINLDSWTWGNWTLYGRFRSGDIQSEIHLPMYFSAYNNDNARNVNIVAETDREISLGSRHTEILTGPGKVDECLCEMPTKEIFRLGGTTSNEITFKNLENEGGCELTIDPVTKEMLGEWKFIVKFNDDVGKKLFEGQSFFNLVQEAASEEIDGNESNEDSIDVPIVLLSQINHFTRQQAAIDISLSKESFEEECYLRHGDNDFINVDHTMIEGVKMQSKSRFVSCRVTIGPMSQELLGDWELCGKSVVNTETRCQPVRITWYNKDGSGDWNHINEQSYTHPVNIGGSVNSGVSGSGIVTTCHVVTPAGENLVITSDVTYPHIERSTISNSYLCSILFKDITEDVLGDWLIYGRFRSVLEQSEVRLPLTFNFYNEDNPYDQAYNVTILEAQNHLVNLGTNLSIEVRQKAGTVEDCIYTLPSGESVKINVNEASALDGVTLIRSDTDPFCQVSFNPITEHAIGQWQIIGKFRNGVLFEEKRLTFKIIKEDPENPIPDNIERVIESVTEQTIITDMNTTHVFTIDKDYLIEHESCHLVTPDGLQYAFIPGFNVPGIEILQRTGVECGIVLHMDSENMIGKWGLIARAIKLSKPIERRRYFNMRVEEHFVIQNDIHIKEGADLYLHLNSAIHIPETCVLYGPDGKEYTNVEPDPVFMPSCGYIVRGVDHSHSGTWVIEYGYKIKNIGSVDVHVIDLKDLSLDDMQWNVGDSINITVGPKNAVYCMIRDGYGVIVFDNFGQCKIVLDRVTIDHMGYWIVSVGLPGSVRLQQYGFYVNIHVRDGKPLVTTTVSENGPSVMLTCSMPVENEIHACKFRDPRDNILIASHGVGEDGYMFNMSIVNYESDAHSHDCTLRIINPSTLDLGIWRCALDTSSGTYYGFLTVLIPHLMQDPSVAASVVTEPILKAISSSPNLEGEPVSLGCSIPSALRYCYFRACNGTVYNVFPRMLPQDNFEYVGAGLDAGECGIRFKRLSVSESKGWSCHVGLVRTSAKELRVNVYADVRVKMVVRHYWNYSPMLVVEARVYNGHALDYCRFVRVDGKGFTSDNLPIGYELYGSLHMGFCILHIRNPTINDLHPWTVAAKLMGAEGEISTATTDNLFVLSETPDVIAEILFWSFIITMVVIPIMAATVLIPKKNRDRAFRRAGQMRESFRNSWNSTFRKTPLSRPQEA